VLGLNINLTNSNQINDITFFIINVWNFMICLHVSF